jgi:hypothetical protein
MAFAQLYFIFPAVFYAATNGLYNNLYKPTIATTLAHFPVTTPTAAANVVKYGHLLCNSDWENDALKYRTNMTTDYITGACTDCDETRAARFGMGVFAVAATMGYVALAVGILKKEDVRSEFRTRLGYGNKKGSKATVSIDRANDA